MIISSVFRYCLAKLFNFKDLHGNVLPVQFVKYTSLCFDYVLENINFIHCS